MILPVQLCIFVWYIIAFTIIVLRVQVGDFMEFLILHCFYHYFFNHCFMVQIHKLMKLLIFRWFYDHHWMVWHMTFMTFCLLHLLIFQGALSDFQGHQRTIQRRPKELLRLPQCPPRDFPTHFPRTPTAGNPTQFYVDRADCHHIISKMRFV